MNINIIQNQWKKNIDEFEYNLHFIFNTDITPIMQEIENSHDIMQKTKALFDCSLINIKL